ncbi:MAG: hypothetical protein AAF419_04355, partial [Pseudomonadota bacterium]
MTRSERIKKIINLSENKERIAAREFIATQKVLTEYKERLKQLKQYRQEYTIYMKPVAHESSIQIVRCSQV